MVRGLSVSSSTKDWVFASRAKVVTIWFAILGLRALWRFNPCWLNHCAEKYFKQYSVVDAGVRNNTTYIALLVHARRPSLLNMK